MCCDFSNLLGCDCGGLTVPDFVLGTDDTCNIINGTDTGTCCGAVGGTTANTCCCHCCPCCPYHNGGTVGGAATGPCTQEAACNHKKCGCRNNGFIGGIVAGTANHRCRRRG